MNEPRTLKFQKSDESFASLITLARRICGLTQDDVRNSTGIGRTQLSMIENGYQLPTRLNYDRLMKLYKANSEDVKYGLHTEIYGAWKREMLREIKLRIGMAEEELETN